MAYRKIENWDEVIEKIISVLKIGGTLTEACSYAGVDRTTLFKKIKKDDKLATKIEDAKEFYRLWIKQEMYKIFIKLKDEGNLESALKHLQWLAERKLRDEFATKQVIENESDKIAKEKEEVLKVLVEIAKEDDKSKNKKRKGKIKKSNK